MTTEGMQLTRNNRSVLATAAAAPAGTGTLMPNGQIVSEASGKCLDASGQTTADDSPTALWSCNSGPNEAWSRLQRPLTGGRRHP